MKMDPLPYMKGMLPNIFLVSHTHTRAIAIATNLQNFN